MDTYSQRAEIARQPAPIAYFTQIFPGLTQTFVYREVLALRERGIPILAFSVWPPDPGELSAETLCLKDETFYIFPLTRCSLLLAHLNYVLERPLRYVGTLTFVLTRPGESLHNRWRSLLHFLYGMLAIREMDRLHVRHIHVHFAWSASSIALMAYRLLDIPFSLTLHSNEIFFDRLLLKDKVRYARFVVTISEYNRKLLQGLWPDLDVDDKVHVIHCGLDPQAFAPPESQKDEHEYTILGVGQLAPRKGFHVLIEACHYLSERGVRFRCHILGEGPERGRLEALIQKYALREQVRMPGWVYQEEIRQYLDQADVFALPCVRDSSGDQDGIPVVLMEAMAMELATVSTGISGIPELIAHGQSGLLTPTGDAVALADALQRLANDAELRERLGRAGRETVISAYNIRRSAEQMALLFERTV